MTKQERINFALDSALKKKVVRLAKKADMRVSQYLRKLIKEAK